MATDPVFYKVGGTRYREGKTYGYVKPLQKIVDNVTGGLFPGLGSLAIKGVKTSFNITNKSLVLNFKGKVGLEGLISPLPTLPPQLGGDTLSSIFLKGKIIFKGKAQVGGSNPLVAKDFKTKLIKGNLEAQANNSKGALLLGLEKIRVPFTQTVSVNKQIIGNTLATLSFVDTSNISATPSGLFGSSLGGLLGGGSSPMVLPII